jgi:glutaredoxin 3
MRGGVGRRRMPGASSWLKAPLPSHGAARRGVRFKHRDRESSLAILCEVMSKITVYTTDPCSFCARVKALLSARKLEFAEINLSRDPAGRTELARKTGMMSFPQVLIGEHLVGGYTEVKAAADSGALDELLAA